MGSLYYITPLKGAVAIPPAWTPLNLANKLYWYRSDDVTLSGSDVTMWPTMTSGTNGVDLNFNTTPKPQYFTNFLNGQAALQFQNSSAAGSTSPSSDITIGDSIPWAVSYVHKGPSLTSGTYYSNFMLSGVDDSHSATLFYTNLSGLPVFYFQVGTGTVTVITIPDFDITQWHTIIINYDGSGNLQDPTKYTIYLNGVSQTVSAQSETGGGNTDNQIGDVSGGGAVNAGYYTEIISCTSGEITGVDLTGILSYYNTLYGV